MARKRARRAEIADDVLREVFARLPDHHDLLRCAATCRRWRRLVTDRAFLRRAGLWPDTARRPCVLAGIFSQKIYPTGLSQSKRDTSPEFLSLQAAGTHLTFDTLGDFANCDAELFDFARPLASRCGFLLVRIVPPHEYFGQRLRLAVCRPLVNKRTTCLLPPPPFNMTKDDWNSDFIIGCTILTGADRADNGDRSNPDQKQQHQQAATTKFQVLVIYTDDNGILCACTYSSDVGTWNAHVECCQASLLTRCGPRAGLVTRGTVHWLFMDERNRIFYTLDISVVTSRVSFTAISINVHASVSGPPIPCIAGEQRRLSFVTIRDNGVTEIWTDNKKDIDDENHVQACDRVWRCSELTDLGTRRPDLVFFAESRGALLIEQDGEFCIVDLKSKEKTPLHLMKERTAYLMGTRRFPSLCTSTYCCGCTCGDTTPVLYEMDWVIN